MFTKVQPGLDVESNGERQQFEDNLTALSQRNEESLLVDLETNYDDTSVEHAS